MNLLSRVVSKYALQNAGKPPFIQKTYMIFITSGNFGFDME